MSDHGLLTEFITVRNERDALLIRVRDLEGAISALPIVPWNGSWAIRPTHEAANAFWKYWRENGETHKHGYYESTWGAINRALRSQSDAAGDAP